jgi:hypothetical protein
MKRKSNENQEHQIAIKQVVHLKLMKHQQVQYLMMILLLKFVHENPYQIKLKNPQLQHVNIKRILIKKKKLL